MRLNSFLFLKFPVSRLEDVYVPIPMPELVPTITCTAAVHTCPHVHVDVTEPINNINMVSCANR